MCLRWAFGKLATRWAVIGVVAAALLGAEVLAAPEVSDGDEGGKLSANSALSDCAVPSVSVQLTACEQPPPEKPRKAAPGAGAAVRVTAEF